LDISNDDEDFMISDPRSSRDLLEEVETNFQNNKNKVQINPQKYETYSSKLFKSKSKK